MNLIITVTYLILLGLIILLIILLIKRNDHGEAIEINSAILSPAEIEKHAVEVARGHISVKSARNSNWLASRVLRHYRQIFDIYKKINDDIAQGFPVPPAAEWLLDNFYIIEEQAKDIHQNLKKLNYSRLPVLKKGYIKGYPRIFAIAFELVTHTDGNIDEKAIVDFIKSYQTQTLLSVAELWTLPIMLRVALIWNIRNICDGLIESQKQRHEADELIDEIYDDNNIGDEKKLDLFKQRLKDTKTLAPAFAAHLLRRLRNKEGKASLAINCLEEKLAEQNSSAETIVSAEHQIQAARQVSIGNSIISLKSVSSMDWMEIFESLSQVESILRQDPSGIYSLMDFDSRDYYRHMVKRLAKKHNTSETAIAMKAVECASKASESENAEKHVGYYLLGKGRKKLEQEVGRRRGGLKPYITDNNKRASYVFLGTITLILLLVISPFIYYAIKNEGYISLAVVLVSVIILIPASDIAVALVNFIATRMFEPVIIPKLELKEGIPEEFSTMVIVPTLLPSEKRVGELLRQMETNYLSNREDNIYFALVGDFKDSQSEHLPEDTKIINAALEGIRKLNEKYAKNGKNVFYFFHRHRQHSPAQGRWMGWERKRGAIIELNDLLRGSENTSYSIISCDKNEIPHVKYVITIDADTIMPIGSAKRLIGAIVHPMNRAIIDREKGIVSEGYGLLQPRIDVNITSANSTLFSKIFAGQGGIDPYTTAVSDVYQDIFGEGIFTGKGIYELDVFQELLKDAIPENAVLSHDLLEGSYVRTGLVSDIFLVDGYPARYNSSSMRLHRWVRGDWQLIPWLGSRIRDRHGNRRENPLSIISRWKIFDNLRRSLVNPFLLLLIILGGALFPGNSLVWVCLALVTSAFHTIMYIIGRLLSGEYQGNGGRRSSTVISGFRASLYQSLFQIIFIPYQAYLMSDAIIRTIVRVLFTKRNMLEWVTAADMEASLKNDLGSYWRRMWISPLAGIAVFILAYMFSPEASLISVILLVLWGTAPYTAFIISMNQEKESVELDDRDIIELRRIARKTWRYFEDMVTAEDNYLPPDNYQEDPPNGVAHRTSPTNIGLMLASTLSAWDFGYVGMIEMLKKLDDSISVIEKLDKWQGHLYNWYDTSTLEVLRPAYVSTVDSGNFVGYLITLEEGLKSLLGKTLIDKQMILGIRDTALLFNEENAETGMKIDIEPLNKLAKAESLNIREFKSLMDNLQSILTGNDISHYKVKKCIWGKKLLAMLSSFRKDLAELFPLLELSDEEIAKLGLDDSVVDVNSFANLSLMELCQRYDKALELLSEHGKGEIAEEEKIVHPEAQNNVSGNIFNKAVELIEKGKKNTDRVISSLEDLIRRISALAEATKFGPLFDKKKQLFSIGYNIEENRLTKSYYDLFASEARQASYIAIARGEVDKKHWFRLGRRITMIDGYRGLVSWTGTMFEYLMPLLVMKSFGNTLLSETYDFVVKAQEKYGRSRGIPWGTSESAYFAFDMKLNYQYRAFGVPELGLKRGLVNDMVVAPYATLLALGIDPVAVLKNIRKLINEGMDGSYGLYEAIDYTPSRLRNGEKSAIVKSYMAHHLGMSMLALDNFLNKNIMQERFHSNPMIRSAELLLQERIPDKALITKKFKEKLVPVRKTVHEEKEVIRRFGIPEGEIPEMHVMSNGEYSVMLTDGGSGYSKLKDIAVSRWQGYTRGRAQGTFIFVQNINSNTAWSATYEPFNAEPEEYSVTFYPDKAVFKRKDGNIETRTEVMVSTEENAEIRRVTLTNHSQHDRTLEVTSYLELVLAPMDADIAHPAFSNLFVTTEFMNENNCLLASRRPRSAQQKPVWAMHSIAFEGNEPGNLQYETDRSKFIGRNRDLSNPVAMEADQPLSDTAGSVLDPIMSLRKRVTVHPGQSVKLSYITAIGDKKSQMLEIAEKYSDPKAIDRAFELAWNRSRIESGYLGFKAEEVELYLKMIPSILIPGPVRKKWAWAIEKNRQGQSGLWKFGISGDVPIILITIKDTEEIDLVSRILKAHEYWGLKGIFADLVILLHDESSYIQPLYEAVRDAISSSHARYMVGARGGVFILDANAMEESDIMLLYTAARIVLKGDAGAIGEQLKAEIEKPAVPLLDTDKTQKQEINDSTDVNAQYRQFDISKLKFFNGVGGFSSDGQEYVICLRDGVHTYAPWINVISNSKFGFIISESGGGHTWSENSRENKLTPWSNDPVTDTPGEVLYIRDEDTGKYWSITPKPIRESGDYIIRHGWGYTVFERNSYGIRQCLTEFVPVEDPVKICLVQLENTTDAVRDLSITYYIMPVLGVNESSTAQYITTRMHKESGMMLITNTFNPDFQDRVAFVGASEPAHSFTGDRAEFIGLRGSLENPEALKRSGLSGKVGAGLEPCAAVQVKVSLEPGRGKSLVFLLGQAANLEEALQLADRYREPVAAEKALDEVKTYWMNKLKTVQVNTPDESINIMLNGWLLYQVVSCRLWARSAFYQSGGAYGYRDQLQDVMAVVHAWPELTKRQILLHSSHQFVEGDVQHWWHPGADKGIRTRYSDDYLWLPYVTADYIRNTGDWGILDEITGYLEDEPLAEDEDERYNKPRISDKKSSVYEHCIRAVENGLKFGPHGIPLMGSGDWNDGMNTVGNKGKGESVWLGWFLYTVLSNFIPICIQKGDIERGERYKKIAQDIVEAIEANAWDGSWYRRAYFDDGTPLGSAQNSECRIDAIAQSWSVISGAGKESRVKEAMHAVRNHLVDREVGIIKLLTPPFDDGDLQPGYIKGYVPGVRENGGQYTHAAVWAVMAFAKLGEGDTAGDLYQMINPINHARTPMESSRYRVEPYVMAADVYAVHPNVGRGGWTWYTGAAGWMYRVGLEHLLGIKKEGDKIMFAPCIPSTWREYGVEYRFGTAVYKITVKNPEAKNKGVKSVSLDGKTLEDAVLPLIDDGIEHHVEVLMG